MPSLGIVLLALLLAGFAYGGWFAAQSGGELCSQLRALPGSIGQHAARMFEEEDASAVAESAAGEQVADGEPRSSRRRRPLMPRPARCRRQHDRR